ncbi:MAG: ABC transporter permease [Planctomycetes bacterium]|nr:ABC transporter permease [Planctomycetota bacterium]
MFAYVLRRVLYMPLILFGVILLTFTLFYMVASPDALAKMKLGEKATRLQVLDWQENQGYITWTDDGLEKRQATQRMSTAEAKEVVFVDGTDYESRSWLGLFGSYVGSVLTFDFGNDRTDKPVSERLWEGLGPSLSLTLPAFLISELVGVFFGLFAAMYRQSRIDHTIVISAIILMSFNGIALIMFGQKFLAADWAYFPVHGFEAGFQALRFLILPIILYLIITLGEKVRFNRIVMLDEVDQDYVRTARSKGANENTVLFKHVLRNSLIPLITRWTVAIASLYVGSLVLESFFGIPGLGSLTIDAIANNDVNVIRAIVILGAISFMIANLLSDVLYAVVDPRVRLE